MVKHPKKPKEKKEELSADERELFLNAFFQGDIALDDKFTTPAIAKKSPRCAPPQQSDQKLDEADRQLFLQAVNDGFKDSYAHHKPLQASHGSKKNVAVKKKSMLDAEIDLHGYTVDDALFALQKFIEREQLRGSRTLLIVHGKGTGVLKKAVWAAISIHPLVHDYQMAAGKLGGQGAIVVRINRKARH